MGDYQHHVPGRLRVRCKALRYNSAVRLAAIQELKCIEGITAVRLNPKAGSVVIQYNTDVADISTITRVLKPLDAVIHVANSNAAHKRPAAKWNLTREIGKIAFNVLISRSVSASLSSVLGARA